MTAEKYDIVIIGAGLGGLECGYILQKHGKRVCIVEKDALIGGCLQTFRRGTAKFDTGFHYIGSLEEGQVLHKLFTYFGLMDLPWVKLDEECFDEVVIKGESYPIANGYERFKDKLAERFPHQRKNLEEYIKFLKEVGDGINDSFNPMSTYDFYSQSLFAESAYDYLCKTITDERLRDVLSGTALKMELNAEKLPLYVFAQISSSFIQSAYRLQGGGMQIAERLRDNIEKLGGRVEHNAEVTGVVEDDGKIKAVVINNGERTVEADMFISDAHPATTMNLLAESKLIRNIYRKRINNLENTFGIFTVNLSLKPNAVKYLNRNIFVYTDDDLWHINDNAGDDVKAIFISIAPPEDGSQYTCNIDLLTAMKWDKVAQWHGTKVGRRGAYYEAMKREMAEKCIALASQHVEGLADAIEHIYTSTPLTYADYTGTHCGSAYGIRKNYNELMYTVLTPKTPVPNLLLTGQSLNLHGILGVSMTAVITCAEILGLKNVVNEIYNANKEQ